MTGTVIVGASLCGLHAATELRSLGYTGTITLIGEEPPYDRPPLSKSVITGSIPADGTALAPPADLNAHWRLGVRAEKLDTAARTVLLSGGGTVSYDRLLIATGSRSPAPSRLAGIHTVRTAADAESLRRDLAGGPRRVLIVGAGFTGGEIAGSAVQSGHSVTVVQRGNAPLASALGSPVGAYLAGVYAAHGVTLRCGVTVDGYDGDDRVRSVVLSDGTRLDTDVVVVATGSVAAVDWLRGAGLRADARGVHTDSYCRAIGADGRSVPGLYAAGDVARFPHPLADGAPVRLDHWGSAVLGGRAAARNMLAPNGIGAPYTDLPRFWSNQFDRNIKSIGFPHLADSLRITQGSVHSGTFTVVYGRAGSMVGAASIDMARALEGYVPLVISRAPFTIPFNAPDQIGSGDPIAFTSPIGSMK